MSRILQLLVIIRRLILFTLIIGLCSYYLVIPLARLFLSTHPVYGEVQGSPADRGLIYEPVTFHSMDGIRLVGWYIPSRNRAAVILTHGFSGNRNSLIDLAEILAKQGFGVLAYDLRDHGDSQKTAYTRGWLEVNDLLGALAYLRTRPDIDPSRIGAFGSSIGAQITLQAAIRTGQIKAIAVEGAVGTTLEDEPAPNSLADYLDYPAQWVFFTALSITSKIPAPQSITDGIGSIAPRPLLLISAGRDHEQQQNRKFFEAAEQPKTLWEIPEASHIGGLSARPQEYRQRLIQFFSDALLGPRFNTF